MKPQRQLTFPTLRTALETHNWTTVKRALSAQPTVLPPHPTPRQIATLLNTVRTVADSLFEASSFATAFETSFATRRALHGAGAAVWAIAALRGFAPFHNVVAPLAEVLRLLGVGAEGRGLVGKHGGVDLLTKLWHRHTDCLEIVSALVSLCPGHIDNVSRTMRQRGLVVAIDVLQRENILANPPLLRSTLILIGMCAICTPDNKDEGTRLVPAVVQVLEKLNAENKHPDVAQQALSALANVGDCWLKEHNGYEIAEPRRVAVAVVDTWAKNKGSKSIAAQAARALLALLSSHSAVNNALLAEPRTLFELTSQTRSLSFTNARLHDIIVATPKLSENALSTSDNAAMEEAENDHEEQEPSRSSSEDTVEQPVIYDEETENGQEEQEPSTSPPGDIVEQPDMYDEDTRDTAINSVVDPESEGSSLQPFRYTPKRHRRFQAPILPDTTMLEKDPHAVGMKSNASLEPAENTTRLFEFTRRILKTPTSNSVTAPNIETIVVGSSTDDDSIPVPSTKRVTALRLKNRRRSQRALTSMPSDKDYAGMHSPPKAKKKGRKRPPPIDVVSSSEVDDVRVTGSRTLLIPPVNPRNHIVQGRPKRRQRRNIRYQN